MQQGLQLITSIRKDRKNYLMPMQDKILLRKRALIETVNDLLKNISQIEHSPHRSMTGFIMTNVLSALIAYSWLPNKPSLRFYQQQVPSQN
jgi:hypothetical protein